MISDDDGFKVEGWAGKQVSARCTLGRYLDSVDSLDFETSTSRLAGSHMRYGTSRDVHQGTEDRAFTAASKYRAALSRGRDMRSQ